MLCLLYLYVIQEVLCGGVGPTVWICAVHHGDHGEAQTQALRHHHNITEVQEET